MVYKKILGSILILLGLVVITFTIFETYNIFTAKKEPPQIFEAVTQITSKEEKPKTPEEKMQALQQEMIAEQFQKMLPIGSLVTLFNLISWSMGAMILFFGGSKISQIGINLLKVAATAPPTIR